MAGIWVKMPDVMAGQEVPVNNLSAYEKLMPHRIMAKMKLIFRMKFNTVFYKMLTCRAREIRVELPDIVFSSRLST